MWNSEPSGPAAPRFLSRSIAGLVLRFALLAVWGWAAATLLSRSSVGESLELRVYNTLFEYRFGARLPPPPRDVALVAIDDPSLAEIGRPWPWPRSLHARVVDRLTEAGARAIVVDLLFSEPSADPAEDQALAASLAHAGNVVLASTIERTQARIGGTSYERAARVNPIAGLRVGAAAVGIAEQPLDLDGFVRRGWALWPGPDPGGGRETLAGAALKLVNPQTRLPEGDIWINFRGPPGIGIERVSCYQVLEGTYPPSFFRGRVVFVGKVLSAEPDPREADSFLVPYFRGAVSRMAGVEIQANLFSSLVRGDSLQTLPPTERSLLLAAEVALAAALFLVFRPAPALALALAMILLHWAAAWNLFAWGRWIPVAGPAAGVVLTYLGDTIADYVLVEKDRRKVRRAFAQYMDPTVLNEVLRNPRMLKLGGEELVGTVLFTDLQGFTSLAEKMAPSELVNFLNEYFTEMLAVIRSHRGTFDKFIGDAVMAFWGIPVRSERHAAEACLAAIAMQRRMEKLNLGWRERGLPTLAMRIGIATGPVVAGNMGSRDLFDYTVMGDTVNLASRLEGTNKIYGTRILAAESTRARLGPEILVRELDRVAVKGKEEALRVYEIIGEAAGADRATSLLVEAFAAGVEAYRGRRWDEAISHFQEALRVLPEDPPSLLYLRRCEAFRGAPPPPDWTGIFKMETK